MRRLVGLLLLCATACSPAPLAPRSVPRSWNLPVEVREEPGFVAAVLPVRGSYDQHFAALTRLQAALERAGLPPCRTPFGRYLNDAGQVREDELRWEVGCAVPPGTRLEPPLELRTFGPQLVASARGRGPYAENSRSWPALMSWITAHDYQPVGAAMELWSGETELRVPIVQVQVVPLLLRYLVCIAGLALFTLFLLSRVRGGRAAAPLRGGLLWALFGATCAIAYLQPLIDDLFYLYGGFLPEALGRWVPTLWMLAGAIGSLVPAVTAHVFFRLMRPRLGAPRAFGAMVALLYAAAAAAFLVVLGRAPEVLVRLEDGRASAIRSVGLAVLVLAMLAAERPRPADGVVALAGEAHGAERRIYRGLALTAAAAAVAVLLPLPLVVRSVAMTALMALPIPFLLAAAYFHERAVLFDVVAKRGVRVLATLAAAAAYFAWVPGRLWSERMGWVGSWVLPAAALPFMLAAPWFAAWLAARVDRRLGRPLSPTEAHRRFVAEASAAAGEEELLRTSERLLDTIFPAGGPPGPWPQRVQVALGPPAILGPPPASGAFEAPIVLRGERVGTMRIATPPEARPFLSEDRALFTALGEALGLVLDGLRLRERKLEQERAAQELRLLASRAELRALRAQVNPHFVFNALNAIAELVATDPVRAEATVERLAEVLRGTLRRSEAEWARVDDELALVRAYLEVERIRFGPRLAIEIDAAGGAGEALVPAMMIQTLVENAVKHGVSARPGPGRIEVRAACAGEALELAVRDSGPGFGPSGSAGSAEPDAPGAGLGLRNVRERLAAHFGAAASLRVERDEGEGMTVVTISMPLRRAAAAPPAEEVG